METTITDCTASLAPFHSEEGCHAAWERAKSQQSGGLLTFQAEMCALKLAYKLNQPLSQQFSKP